MTDTPQNRLQAPVRSRRSRSSTPLVQNGVQPTDTPRRNALYNVAREIDLQQGEDYRTPDINMNTPLGKQVDASFRTGDKVSPMLAKLRMTPGRLLKEKQSILQRKHEESRRKVDSLNVGGGVSLWPEMQTMRLTTEDVYHLAAFCVTLCGTLTALFYCLHGLTIRQLLQFQQQLSEFSETHIIQTDGNQESLDRSLVHWHVDYRKIVDGIHEEFDVTNVPASYFVYILIYTATLGTLFYYLVDNMFAKSKLSPNRIRKWVTFLSLASTWTMLMLVTLVIALRAEVAVETNIYMLSNVLADIIPTQLSCDKFNTILSYWKTRCLPPTTHGTISIFGLLPVRDVTFYLQYYSIPICTVLLTPVFKLIVSLMSVYNIRNDSPS